MRPLKKSEAHAAEWTGEANRSAVMGMGQRAEPATGSVV